METEYKEVGLADYAKVVNKRKKIILAIFFAAVLIAVAISFFSPKIYRVDTILEIGKTTSEKDGEKIIEDPSQVKGKFDNNIYSILAGNNLNISENNYPAIKADIAKNTNSIIIKSETDKPETVKIFLEEINSLIISEHQEKVKNARDLIDKNIKMVEENIKLAEDNIKNTENKIVPVDGDIERIGNKIKSMEEEKRSLEEKIDALQKVPNYQQDPGTQFALFSTQEKLANKKQEIESLYMGINSLKNQKENLQIEVNSFKKNIEEFNLETSSLNGLKNNIKETKEIKPPTISKEQISPRPVLNIAIGAVLGLFLGLFMAFGKEWWNNSKK